MTTSTTNTTPAAGSANVLVSAAGGLGRITLDRPAAINALDHAMILAITRQLDAWRTDDTIRAVLLTGNGERGFCAGGDVRAMARDSREGRPQGTLAYLRDEYRLDRLIASYPKPVVSLMDGIAMGGGIGIGGNASVRVVTERSRLAMPETRIGFAPDAGGSFLLSRAPGQLGVHLALTAGTMTGADAIGAGFADVCTASERLPELVEALQADDGQDPQAVARAFAAEPPPSPLAAERAWIDACYAQGSVLEILDRLRSRAEPAARAAAEEILRHAPRAVSVALELVRRARALPDASSALEAEWRMASGLAVLPDFVEGVRAQLIDKDREPRWDPARLEDVDADEVERILATAPPEPL